MDRDGVEDHKLAKKKRNKASIKPSLPDKLGQQKIFYGFRGIFSLRETAGCAERARYLYLPTQVANHSAGFDCSLAELAI